MSEAKEWVIHTDGGSRGNPGPAAYAYTIERPGEPDIEERVYIGETTNNIAEYEGLVKALTHAAKLGGRQLRVRSDSELLVKQMNGEYQVKNSGIRPLYEEAARLRRTFLKVTIEHIRRDLNKRADALCNEALDRAAGKTSKPAARESVVPTSADDLRKDLEARVREEALACLQASAAAWARSGGSDPPAEQVWDQLWSILVEAKVLRPARK